MIERSNDPSPLSKAHSPKNQISLKYRQHKIMMHPNLRLFCELLAYDDLITSQHISSQSSSHSQDSIIQLEIPSHVQISMQHFSILENFMKIHKFYPQNVSIGKINIMNEYEHIGPQTQFFVKTTLDPMTTQGIKDFLGTIKYLGASAIQKVVYTYLGKRLALPLKSEAVKSILCEKGIQQYDSHQINALKQEMIPFFEAYGYSLLEKYEQKMKNK